MIGPALALALLLLACKPEPEPLPVPEPEPDLSFGEMLCTFNGTTHVRGENYRGASCADYYDAVKWAVEYKRLAGNPNALSSWACWGADPCAKPEGR